VLPPEPSQGKPEAEAVSTSTAAFFYTLAAQTFLPPYFENNIADWH
jgi:hypothetical protein